MTILSYEVNLDLSNIERSGYTILDMLAELGGIQAILFGAFRLIVYFLNYNNFASQVAKHFFQMKDNNNSNSNNNDDPPDCEKTISLKPSKLGNIQELFV